MVQNDAGNDAEQAAINTDPNQDVDAAFMAGFDVQKASSAISAQVMSRLATTASHASIFGNS